MGESTRRGHRGTGGLGEPPRLPSLGREGMDGLGGFDVVVDEKINIELKFVHKYIK